MQPMNFEIADEQNMTNEACPGCGNEPGDGLNPQCNHSDGCGYWRNVGPFYVMCRVSGGVTGTRQMLLKSNGQICPFESRDAAAAKADELNRKMNHAYSVADFRYWPVNGAEASAYLD